MFELCRELIVERLHGPFIFEEFCLISSFIDHRFYREGHPWFHDDSGIFRGLMVDEWIFVEFYTDSVASIFSHDSVAIFLSVLRDREPDIPDKIPRSYLIDTEIHAIFRHLDEFFSILANCSDGIHA